MIAVVMIFSMSIALHNYRFLNIPQNLIHIRYGPLCRSKNFRNLVILGFYPFDSLHPTKRITLIKNKLTKGIFPSKKKPQL